MNQARFVQLPLEQNIAPEQQNVFILFRFPGEKNSTYAKSNPHVFSKLSTSAYQ